MRRLLATLALLCAFGAPAALPVQAAPLPAPLTAPAAFTSYTSTAMVSNASLRRQTGWRRLLGECASADR